MHKHTPRLWMACTGNVCSQIITILLGFFRSWHHAMEGLVCFAFHFGIPHSLEYCFQAKNGTIHINTPPHYVWYALEMFVPNCLTPFLPFIDYYTITSKVLCGLISIMGWPIPWNAVFNLRMVPYALNHHFIMYGMHWKCLCPNLLNLYCLGQVHLP